MQKFFVLIISVLLITSCKGPQGAPGPAGGAGSGLTGEMKGGIGLFDSAELPVSEQSGVKVTVSGPVSTTTTTGSSGTWSLPALPSGTYNILFEKSGYGTRRLFSVQHSGGPVPTYPWAGKMPMYPVSGASISNFSISSVGKSISVKGAVPLRANGTETNLVLFVGKTKSPTPTSYDFMTTSTTNGGTVAISFDYYLPSWKQVYGIKSGDRLFCSLHTVTSFSDISFDPDSGAIIYPSVNPIGASFEFIIP